MRARRIKLAAGVVLVVLAIPACRWVRHNRPWESPEDRAHRLCGECGLTSDDVDWLIDANRHSTLTREQLLELFYATFEDRRDVELCEPCTEAVLDAAGAR